MLYIKNRETLNGLHINIHRDREYYVNGVYECNDHYQIHIRCNNRQIVDELLILLRNKKVNQNGDVYEYYQMYDSNKPNNRLNLPKGLITMKHMFIQSIETILQMSLPQQMNN